MCRSGEQSEIDRVCECAVAGVVAVHVVAAWQYRAVGARDAHACCSDCHAGSPNSLVIRIRT